MRNTYPYIIPTANTSRKLRSLKLYCVNKRMWISDYHVHIYLFVCVISTVLYMECNISTIRLPLPLHTAIKSINQSIYLSIVLIDSLDDICTVRCIAIFEGHFYNSCTCRTSRSDGTFGKCNHAIRTYLKHTRNPIWRPENWICLKPS